MQSTPEADSYWKELDQDAEEGLLLQYMHTQQLVNITISMTSVLELWCMLQMCVYMCMRVHACACVCALCSDEVSEGSFSQSTHSPHNVLVLIVWIQRQVTLLIPCTCDITSYTVVQREEGKMVVLPAAKFLVKVTHCCPSTLTPPTRVTSSVQVPDESSVSGHAPSPPRHWTQHSIIPHAHHHPLYTGQ